MRLGSTGASTTAGVGRRARGTFGERGTAGWGTEQLASRSAPIGTTLLTAHSVFVIDRTRGLTARSQPATTRGNDCQTRVSKNDALTLRARLADKSITS